MPRRFPPVVGIGAALLAFVWGATLREIGTELDLGEERTAHELTNVALLLEQNARHIAEEGDRVLKHLRGEYVRNGHAFNWSQFEAEELRYSSRIAFLFVVDATGKVLYSTGYGTKPRALNLADRPYLRVHAGTSADQFYISPTMSSRKDAAPLICMSRKFLTADGQFAGALVLGVDPTRLTHLYRELQLGSESGVAIVGTDGLVRAATGIYAEFVGRGFREGRRLSEHTDGSTQSLIATERVGDKTVTVVHRALQNYPLEVVVARSSGLLIEQLSHSRSRHLVYATVLTVVVLLVVIASVRSDWSRESAINAVARVDALTGVPNRHDFTETLRARIAERAPGTCLSLLLLDLDGFKAVNDTHGHLVGDRLLKEVAQRLRTTPAAGTFIARLGGDEFALLAADLEDAETVAQRLGDSIAIPFKLDDLVLNLGVSIGIAACDDALSDPTELYRRADVALYSCKEARKGGYSVYSASMDAKEHAERTLVAEMRAAVERGEYRLFYQPIVDMRTQALKGYEALLRWEHPTRGLLGADQFIPAAEKSGCIVEIGRWVIHRACRDIAALDPGVHLSVNVSPVQLATGTLPEIVADALADAGLAPERVSIEITETSILESTSWNRRQLELIKALGASIALDDFGVGFTSLNSLQGFPIDTIKLDRSFIANLGVNRKAESLIRAIDMMARTLELNVIVEGVETDAQRQCLTGLGIVDGQGYFFGRPAPLADHVAATGAAQAPRAA